MGEHVWDVSSLWILKPIEWHSIWVSWLADGSHLGWYINMQRPMQRNTVRFEAMDLMLDVVAEPDLSWRWKDLDEFNEIARLGIFDTDLADRVRSDAHAVIADIEHVRSLFGDPWPSRKPDPAWVVPELPDNWDLLPPTPSGDSSG